MLYYNINYYHNRLFLIDDKYYVYVNVTKNFHIYKVELINNHLFLFIINKNIHRKENFSVRVMFENKELNLNVYDCKMNYIDFGNIDKFKFKESKRNHKNRITEKINSLFPHFDIIYYGTNNNFLKNIDIYNHKYHDFIKNHWFLCGQYQPQMYFKYLLYKHKELILNIKYPFIKYSEENKNTLLFVDDRYDPSFKYLLILFLYSVDLSWNITIFTTKNNEDLYKKNLEQLGIEGKIILLDHSFNNMMEYSELFKDYLFWNKIKEDNVLTFQYDSFCMGKFNPIFFNYNYIGARWPHKACLNENITIGNGGTSFRKTRIMEIICKKYNDIKKNYVEDLFFAESLYEEKLLNCTNEVADQFSFENIYCEHSIYAHQIYNTVKLEDMDNFMYRKISSML